MKGRIGIVLSMEQIEQYETGKPAREIAAIVGKTTVTVLNALRRQGVQVRRPGNSGHTRKGGVFADVARELGISLQLVYLRVKKCQSPWDKLYRGHSGLGIQLTSTHIEMYNSGASLKELSAITGWGQRVISRYLRQQGVELRKGRKRGELLPQEYVEEYLNGKSSKKIAREIGWHWTTVLAALHRQGVAVRAKGRPKVV